MKLSTTFSFLLLFLLSAAAATAIGVSPPSYKVEYQPGGSYELQFHVRNNADGPREATISLKGAMSEYIELSADRVSMERGGLGSFTATLTMPQDASHLTPGRNEVEIYIREVVPTQGGFVAGTGVISSVYVYIPYPGQYAQIKDFTVAEGQAGVNEGEDTPVSFSIVNRGKEELRGTSAEVVLQDQTGSTLDRVRYEDIDITTGSTYSESFSLRTSTMPPGDYRTTLFYTYAGTTINRTRGFSVGNFSVALINHSHEVQQRGIVPFTITAKNRWKGYVYVSATLKVAGTSVAKSSREKVADFRQVELSAFLDTMPLELGTHQGTLSLTAEKVAPQYSGETITETYPVTFELVKPRKAARESPFAGMSATTMILVALLVLLSATIVVSVLLIRKKKV